MSSCTLGVCIKKSADDWSPQASKREDRLDRRICCFSIEAVFFSCWPQTNDKKLTDLQKNRKTDHFGANEAAFPMID